MLTIGHRLLIRTRSADAAAVVRRNIVLIAGGASSDGSPNAEVYRFDQLTMHRDDLYTWPDDNPIGPARGLDLSEDLSLVVADRARLSVSTAPPGNSSVTLLDLDCCQRHGLRHSRIYEEQSAIDAILAQSAERGVCPCALPAIAPWW